MPTNIQIEALQVMKADECGLVLERSSRVRSPSLNEIDRQRGLISNITVFRRDEDSLPPLSFPSCATPEYWCLNTTRDNRQHEP